MYLYLALLGKTYDYNTLKVYAEQSDKRYYANSAASLVSLAARCGVSLSVRKMTPTEVLRIGEPTIVHMDGPSPTEGYFILLVNITASHVYYVNGPTAAILTMSPEQFKRSWSGYAIVRGEARVYLWLIGAATACALLTLYIATKRM
jgi:ABC-type bacteriocin/lantibiotic exporter with double-glycine peptidase domain